MGAPLPPPLVDDATLADAVRDRLRREFGDGVVDSWFGRLQLDGIVDDGATARLSLPTKFLKSWVDGHYHDQLAAAVRAAQPGVTAIQLDARSASRPSLTTLPAAGSPGPEPIGLVLCGVAAVPRLPADLLDGVPLDPALTFDAFVEAPENRHAAVVARVAADPGRASNGNPLVITGPTGCGKTHLLQAIGHAAVAGGHRVAHLTAERLLVRAARWGANANLGDAAIVLVDDVQLATQLAAADALAVLLARQHGGPQLVLTCDRPPAELESLDPRTRSRLAGGLVLPVQPAGQALRQALLARLFAAAGMGLVDPAATAALAAGAGGDVRTLRGVVHRLAAVGGAVPLTPAGALELAGDLLQRPEPRRVAIDAIQRLVAAHYQVSRTDILSARRTSVVVRPRQVAMYLARTLTLRSLPEVGRRFGGRDHTTVLHAVRKIEGLMGADPVFAAEITGLRTMLAGTP